MIGHPVTDRPLHRTGRTGESSLQEMISPMPAPTVPVPRRWGQWGAMSDCWMVRWRGEKFRKCAFIPVRNNGAKQVVGPCGDGCYVRRLFLFRTSATTRECIAANFSRTLLWLVLRLPRYRV